MTLEKNHDFERESAPTKTETPSVIIPSKDRASNIEAFDQVFAPEVHLDTEQITPESYSKASYESIRSEFTSKILAQLLIHGKKPQEKIRLLFGLVSSPESVSSNDLSTVLPGQLHKSWERWRTEPRGAGVFPRIMNTTQQLNCAGRSLVASAVLKELGIDHFICSPDGHSIVLIKNENGFTYFDPQQGLLVENIPLEAISVNQDELNKGTVAKIDVHQCPTATIQGLGYLHKSFLMFTPEAGITEQGMSNTRSAIKNKWITVQDDEENFERISGQKDILFPETDTPNIDESDKRGEELIGFFQMLAKNGWQITKEITEYNYEHQLYPASSEKDFKALVEKLTQWSSKGETDEIAKGISRLTGKPNHSGATLTEFFSAAR
jgi:hypothetical protein